MAFSIRLTEEEKALAESYARLHSISLGEAFKRALFAQIEDEYDLAVAGEAYDEYVKGGKKSRPSRGQPARYAVYRNTRQGLRARNWRVMVRHRSL